MNYKRYINMILLQLSSKYDCVLTEIKTYKGFKKYNSIRLILYKYDEEGNKKQYKNIEARNERDLLIKLKEMI